MRAYFEFDTVFPNAGGYGRLNEVRKGLLAQDRDRVEDTSFTKPELDHMRTMFDLLSGNEEARSTLMGLICYCDSKSKLAQQEF